jgi:hypothetical protein
MPGEGFEPTTPVFERTKTIHNLDRAATVIGRDNFIFIFCNKDRGLILILILYAINYVKMMAFTSLQLFDV